MDVSPPSNHRLARTMLGISAFILCCLLSSLRVIHTAPSPRQIRVDDIASRSDQRFAGLKAKLPERGIIGYVGESGNSGTADYYLAQYALAPLVIDRSPNHPLVIVSFPTAPPEYPKGLQLVNDFGNGVLLFANQGAQ